MNNELNNAVDVIIIGAGVAGLFAANECIKNNQTYHILEANDQTMLGGRIRTELIDLSSHQSTQLSTLPPYYKFDHGAAWIHGVSGSRTLALFDELYAKYEKNEKNNTTGTVGSFSSTQLRPMFAGCAWTNPEFLESNYILLFDPQTQRKMTSFEYMCFIIITTIHLRDIFRTYPNLPFSQFSQAYMNWIEEKLAQFAFVHDTQNSFLINATSSGVIARAIGWYFHSIESYNGISNGKMQAQDVFHHYIEGDAYKTEWIELDFNTIYTYLNTPSTLTSLYTVLQSYIPQYYYTIDNISDNKDNISITPLTDLTDQVIARILTEYKDSIYCEPDAALQGCYPGDHCTTATGMSKLIELLVLDIQTTSQQPLNISYNNLVTTVNTIDPDGVDFTNPQIRAKISTVDQYGQKNIFIAKKGVVVTGSLSSLVKNITFETTLHQEIDNTALQQQQDPCQQPLQEMVQSLHSATDFVYYKKVAFCFPTTWWDNYKTVRLVGTLQQKTNFHKTTNEVDNPCHCGHKWTSPNIATPHLKTSYSPPASPQDNGTIMYENICDISEGGYDCLIAAATAIHENNPFNLSTPEEQNMSLDQFEMEKIMWGVQQLSCSENSFCHINIIFESHYTNKYTSVLSASLVGSLAKRMIGIPNYIVQTMVLASLQSIFLTSTPQSTVLTIPTPIFSRVSQWGENQSILQSYSLITDMKYDSTQRVTIAAKYAVFFAGESCDVDHAGGIHAALFSSERAMKHLLSSTNQMVNDDGAC